MPIRLAQARLIPWDSATPDHWTGIRTLLATGYAPDGEHRPPHQGRDAETSTVSRSNLTCSRSYPKAPTCVNRIGMVERFNSITYPYSKERPIRIVKGFTRIQKKQVNPCLPRGVVLSNKWQSSYNQDNQKLNFEELLRRKIKK